MVSCFFEYLALESEHNNVRNMRICHLLLEHDAVTPAQLNHTGAYKHVSHIVSPMSDCTAWLSVMLVRQGLLELSVGHLEQHAPTTSTLSGHYPRE